MEKHNNPGNLGHSKTNSPPHFSKKKKKNKNSLTLGIIILAVLLIAFVSFLSFFSMEKEILSESDPFDVQCKFFCDTQQTNAFCTWPFQISENVFVTCHDLVSNPQYSSYNVQSCPAAGTCESNLPDDMTCEGEGLHGAWVTPTSEGGCPPGGIQGFGFKLVGYTDEPPIQGQICCFYPD
ncbi:hypothetical protein K0A97_01865 [Patescibacteria group bacterium]|nr:hypothetical protein [Patescibacteria group bacterium]